MNTLSSVYISTLSRNGASTPYGSKVVRVQFDSRQDSLTPILYEVIDTFSLHQLKEGIFIELRFHVKSRPLSAQVKFRFDTRQIFNTIHEPKTELNIDYYKWMISVREHYLTTRNLPDEPQYWHVPDHDARAISSCDANFVAEICSYRTTLKLLRTYTSWTSGFLNGIFMDPVSRNELLNEINGTVSECKPCSVVSIVRMLVAGKENLSEFVEEELTIPAQVIHLKPKDAK